MLGSSIAELGSVMQQIREEAAIIVWSARTVGDDGRLYLRLSCAVCECDQLPIARAVCIALYWARCIEQCASADKSSHHYIR